MKWNPFNTKVGLALGGGAAKGIAHIGVLKAFEEEQVEISYLSGTSIGSLVAAYYAFGKSVDEIWEVGRKLNLQRVVNFGLQKKGFFNTDSIAKMIMRDLGRVRIEDAKIPLAICTTDITTGEKVIFTEGDLISAVCASVAVPGLFAPVEITGRLLVDGGITENVPVSALEKMGAGLIVGIDLNGLFHKRSYTTPSDFMGVIGNSIDISIDQSTRLQLKNADVVLSLELSKYNRLDNSDEAQELFNEGYYPMKRKIKRVLWYKRTNYFQYLWKLFKEFNPLKIPHIFKKS